MSSPDPQLIKEALLAELGRCRQDELPLSDQAKRPTYQPVRGFGTSHFPQARKEKLESKWCDEESQQMEGLELGNSRPWAKIANDYMAHHAVESGNQSRKNFRHPQGPFADQTVKGCQQRFRTDVSSFS
ncbi:hypothetical protein Trco_006281 [Trichoderma cornu-damae]|uniref:Uncharacterized protein n=1 Tax=Trichoderma cornu-damae TaxID=654480 RepID=A0A9P8QGS2_9HYPO|nr:hypothetical protein Trco_006281 [Trichoderma cornu-damae]